MRFAACVCLWSLMACAGEPAKATFERAARALAAGDYAGAERGFKAVLREEPGHVGALGNLGIVYSRTNRTDEAIAVYRRALRVSPNDEAILLNLGLVYLKQETHRRALPLFARVVELDGQNQQARRLLALCQVYTGQTAPAIRELEALHTANPRDEQLLFLLGFAYLKDRNTEAAKRIFEQMFASVGPARTQFLLGRASYEAAIFDKAEESFLEVRRTDPGFPGLHLELGKLYISQRRNEEAIQELKAALRENADNQEANYFLGGLLVQDGEYEKALPYLERSRQLKPDSWATYLYLGKAKLRTDHAVDAVALLQRAVALNPDETPAYHVLGQALQACGRQAEAAQAFAKARNLTVGQQGEKVVGAR